MAAQEITREEGRGNPGDERSVVLEAQQARAEALQLFTEGAAPRRGLRAGSVPPRGGAAERCLQEREPLEYEPGAPRATADEVARLELALARCGLRLRRAAW